MSNQEGPLILAIVGYRGFTDWTLFKETINEFIAKYGMPSSIVSGGAKGADSLAERWAIRHNLPIRIFRPDWKRWGKAAGIMRNTDIVYQCTHMVAFPSQKGKGTQDSIKKATSMGKIVFIKEV